MNVVASVIAAALVCAVSAASAPAGTAAAGMRGCGVIALKETGTARTDRYAVKVIHGRAGCAVSRAVLGSFMRTGLPPTGWICFRGHASQGQAWAATCGALRTNAVIRSYGPLR